MFAKSLPHKLTMVVAALGLACSAIAQTYPAKSINVIVPYPAGGALDASARVLVREMATNLKQTMLIENVSGAGGTIGLIKGLAAAPDGYTVMITDIAAPILSPMLHKNAQLSHFLTVQLALAQTTT